jgi:hypothetical protein
MDEEAFILQEQGVFTRIRSGAAPAAGGGGAQGFSISRAAVEVTMDGGSNRSIAVGATAGNEKP